MESNLKYKIIEYLSRGNALSRSKNFVIVKSWGEEGIDMLIRFATGKEVTDNPKVRTRAMKLLAAYTPAHEKAKPVLETLAHEEQTPVLQLHVFRSYSRVDPQAAIRKAEGAIKEVAKNPAVALAGARHLVEQKGRDSVPDLLQLSEHILQMAGGNRNSPTVLYLKRLIDKAEGRIRPPEKEPKQEV